jgi:DNA-binding GntR family transcriptional regulator
MPVTAQQRHTISSAEGPDPNAGDRTAMMKVESIVDRTVKRLEDMIIKGKLQPGQQVKEQDIADRLGVSRPPVREAFKLLEAEGLVRREPRRGVFVAELTDADIWEIYTLKTALYSLAATLAIDKLTAGGIEKLEKIVDQMEAIAHGSEPPDIIRYEELNHHFHDTTALIAGHGRLKKFQQSINNQVKLAAYRSLADRWHLEQSCRYHRAILDAIKARDKARAEALTREHILKGMAAQERLKTDPHGDPSDSKPHKEALHAVARG